VYFSCFDLNRHGYLAERELNGTFSLTLHSLSFLFCSTASVACALTCVLECIRAEMAKSIALLRPGLVVNWQRAPPPPPAPAAAPDIPTTPGSGDSPSTTAGIDDGNGRHETTDEEEPGEDTVRDGVVFEEWRDMSAPYHALLAASFSIRDYHNALF
jgi:hypothetical protein